MANVGKTRSPAIPSVHDPPDPDLIHQINTTQEHRGTTAKATADTICTPPMEAPSWPLSDTGPHSYLSKLRPPPDFPSLVSDLNVTQTTTSTRKLTQQ